MSSELIESIKPEMACFSIVAPPRAVTGKTEKEILLQNMRLSTKTFVKPKGRTYITKPYLCKHYTPRALITKGNVSPIKPVSPHIPRPIYVTDPNWVKANPLDKTENDEDLIHQHEIVIHTDEEIEKLRKAGKLAKEVLAFAGSLVKVTFSSVILSGSLCFRVFGLDSDSFTNFNHTFLFSPFSFASVFNLVFLGRSDN